MGTEVITDADVTAKRVESRWSHFWRRVMAPALEPEDMTPAQQWYDSYSGMPMFVASLLWILSLFFNWVPALRDDYRHAGFVLSVSTWALFLIDMLIRLVLDPHKENFFKRNWPLVIALVFPPLRILLVGSAVLRIHRDRNALAKMVGLYAVYAVLIVVIFGAVFTLAFEIDAPGSSLHSYGDAVWWGFETVTTVGYGDYTPVTVAGRCVAVVIMFTGAAAVGAVTAAVASRFINNGNSDTSASSADISHSTSTDPEPTSALDAPSLDDLSRQLAALQAQIEQIAGKLGVTVPTADAN